MLVCVLSTVDIAIITVCVVLCCVRVHACVCTGVCECDSFWQRVGGRNCLYFIVMSVLE